MAKILQRIFASYSSRILAYKFFFFLVVTSVLVLGDGGFIECLWDHSLFFNILEKFKKDVCKKRKKERKGKKKE